MIAFLKITIFFLFLEVYCLKQGENICETADKKCLQLTALIPARAGSKGIKDKNLSRMGNETLLQRTLRIINDFGKFESIWVSTDGKAIAEEATLEGAKIHWRDPKTATDNASTFSVVEDFLLTHKECDAIAVIQCTSPFIKKKFLFKALDHFMTTNADCLFSVTKSHQLRWTENEDGFATPLNFNPKKRPRRQDWPGEFVENGMFYFAKKELILQEKTLQNNRCKMLQIPKQFSLEIDTPLDLMLARAMINWTDDSSETS